MSRVSTKFGMFTVCLLSVLLLIANVFAQETTGGLQGTVKDPSGAVVSKASVVVTGSALGGEKSLVTDSSGYYRFANLPPGTYTVAVKASGFSELKREGILVEVGHLPTLDLTLAVGAAGTVVEVTGEAPAIDVTTNTNQTNLTNETLNDTPHGYSFQSVIQFAPMARAEPLAGGSAGMTGNAGGSLPGSAGNGLSVGFSVGGGADSENSYLVEGQDTENISGGASAANVPFQFIQEVQVKSSGIEAEHGGALGGVVNVVMKKGQNAYHGSFFATYEADPLDGSANGTLRYDPSPVSFTPDADSQTYIPKRDHFRDLVSGFTVGGPILKDRIFFFLGFAPQLNSRVRTVDFTPSTFPGSSALGNQVFNNDTQQYFATARIDATVTQKIRVFGSWLYQLSRASGVSLPTQDSVNGLLNTSINSPLTQYSHGLGYTAPNATYNVGADLTLTPKIIATTRYGYFFTNYHDFGWPTQGVDLDFATGATTDNTGTGAPLPASLQIPAGSTTAPYDQSFTQVNASKHYQFDQDVAFFKSGWGGTHNFKFGYQFNKLSNVIDQHGNLPFGFMVTGTGVSYGPRTQNGANNCALLEAEWQPVIAGVPTPTCAGQYGFFEVQDFATVLKTPAGVVVPATDTNHALFVQDAWTVGHGLTLNLGLRIEKENLPAPPGIGVNISSINFAWSQKVEPRLGAAWGSRNGKMKIFGSYGVTNDVMKLLLAQTSWGAQGFETCTYPLGPDGTPNGFSNSDITLAYNAGGRACPTGVANVPANFPSGTPTSLTDAATNVSLIENVNFRPEEPVAHGVNPYRQHEFVAGVDYQLNKDWAFEARYDRRRLDHVIEDASLADEAAFEIYTIVNPGQGVNKTIDGYANYLTSLGDAYGPGTAAFNGDPNAQFGTCPTCPANPVAIRNYDGLEFRLTKTQSRGWSGNFSYTWSRLWGNYTGLTTTDQIDGGTTGRNSPDTTRSFDEPFYYFGANGKSNDGPLPTDRPNVLKGFAYYTLPWKTNTNTTTFGLFQVAYQGSPVSSFADIGTGGSSPIEATYIYGRGQYVNASTDASGNIVLGNPYARRTPWYTQTDANLSHAIKVNKNNEHQVLSFNANFLNLLNQHAVTAYWAGFNSNFFESALFPGGFNITQGAAFYQAAETGYNPQTTAVNSGVVLNSHYGSPNLWQTSRQIRLGAQFTW
jgi:Carboxypeptidase regulatory-like domain